ncbi:MAG: PqqD family protein [Porphyromonadaceae bacterium]|jgi:hypothetical protein|nr:PqqD family protein [Porphyromonadaceae bacterium]
MDFKKVDQLKSRFVSRKVGNELVLVPLVSNVAHMDTLFNLNETAGFLWENLNENSSVEQLKDLLMENFEVDEETAEKDVKEFLEKIEKLEG